MYEFIAENGVKFKVVIIEVGDTYGVSHCLTNQSKVPLVEFYDTRFQHTEHGQFVSRYHLHTLLQSNAGLDLQGGVDSWSIDSKSMEKVRKFLDSYVI